MIVKQSIKKNTIYNAIKTVSSILFPLITFPYISRVLLPENTGKISFASSIVSYFTLMATLGIQTYAIRECSAVRNNKEKLTNTASQIFSINIITTVISYIALTITLLFYHKLDNYRTLIIIQSLSIIANTLGTSWLNSAMEDYRYITIRTVVFQIISLILMLVFVHQPSDYMKYAIISLVSSAGASLCNIWYRRKYCRIQFIRDIRNGIEWKRHMVPIIYLFVMILAQTIFISLDTTMLGIIHGDREVGIYSAAHKMSNLITQVVASLLWVIMPRMSYLFEEGNYDLINNFLRKVLGFNILLGLPCAVGTMMLSEEMVLIISGSEYAEASGVLKVLMIGFVFALFGGSFLGNTILLPSRREKSFMIVCCISALINVITNYLFIPKYGSLAAAGTTALCEFITFVILFFLVDRRIKIKRVFCLACTPVLGSILIVLVCLLCRMIESLWTRTILSIIFSVIAYCIVAWCGNNEVFREFTNSIFYKYNRK